VTTFELKLLSMTLRPFIVKSFFTTPFGASMTGFPEV